MKRKEVFFNCDHDGDVLFGIILTGTLCILSHGFLITVSLNNATFYQDILALRESVSDGLPGMPHRTIEREKTMSLG